MSTKDAEFVRQLEEHKKILYRVVNGYCNNPSDRQDLAQDIVVQLWKAFDSFDDTKRFSTWMYRVALNVAISFYRSETRRAKKTVPVEDHVLEIAAEEPDADRTDEDLRRLERYIERLDELNRALIILYLDGNQYETIAEILGISVTNVATKLSRIKQRFRRDFEESRTLDEEQ
jgi:RNA polymerase sigma factor (sigma-70 family)